MVNINVEPAGAGFTPASIPNLLAWYKADAGVLKSGSVPAGDGDTVATWEDQSGNNYDIQSDAGTPIYRTNQLNGLPIIDCSAASSDLTTNPTAPNMVALGGTLLSAFIVMKYTATGGTTNRVLSVGNGSNDATSDAFTIYENTSTTDVRTYNNGDKSTVTLVASTWNEIGTIFDGANDTMYLNNSASASVAATPTFNANVNIGVLCQCSGLLPILGLVAEAVFYKDAISSANRNLLHTYFLTRWGV